MAFTENQQARPQRVSTLLCPHCGERRTQGVIDSRPVVSMNSIRRRRICACGGRLTTYELPAETLLGLLDMAVRMNQILGAFPHGAPLAWVDDPEIVHALSVYRAKAGKAAERTG